MNSLLHKDLESKFSTHLSASQIWSILNRLLFEAIAPAVSRTSIGIEIGLSCIAISTDGKRKIAGVKATEFLNYCFREVLCTAITPTAENKVALVRNLMNKGLERNIVYEYAQRIQINPPDIPNYDKNKHRNHVKVLLNQYCLFRMDVARRFHNLTQAMAKRNHYNKTRNGLDAEQAEHYSVFTLSLLQAIDKFIPWKAPLAKYIMMWFENAKGSSAFMTYTDEAYSIPRNVRQKVHEGELAIHNKAIPISERENDIPEDFKQSDPELIVNIARIPGSTLLFFNNAIPYYPRLKTS